MIRHPRRGGDEEGVRGGKADTDREEACRHQMKRSQKMKGIRAFRFLGYISLPARPSNS